MIISVKKKTLIVCFAFICCTVLACFLAPMTNDIGVAKLGKTIVIDHGNGYKTSYSHLLSTLVRRGQKVQRGDIIALSGNSGLSLAPHLHYEVRYNDLRIDPIHYFFMELTPDEYQRIMRISQSGMQSFD